MVMRYAGTLMTNAVEVDNDDNDKAQEATWKSLSSELLCIPTQ